MFDIFGREILNDVFVILAMTFGMVVSVAIWKQKTEDHQRDLEHCSTEVSTTVGLLILWMIACVVTVVMAKGACFCYFTQDYGV